MLKRLCCYSKVARVLALRELLERALFRSDNVLFGAHISDQDDVSEKVLIIQNKKIVRNIVFLFLINKMKCSPFRIKQYR